MLAVHWAPVSKTKYILRNGIRKSPNGLYCFPLTGHKALDRWWVNFFNQCRVRDRKKYNGIVFHIEQEDFPAYFGYWYGATNRDCFQKEITSLKQLGTTFREDIMWRLGAMKAQQKEIDNLNYTVEEREELYLRLAEAEISNVSGSLASLLNDLDFMSFTFYDYQLVLSHSIPAKRIVKIMPQGDEFGRVLRRKKKTINKYPYGDDD